ncbi:MAG: ATPase domain-containing protein [Candidatus Micrarchaeia archaeon]
MADEIERIKTGVDGLDNLLFGGIPVGSQVLVAGGPGAGKTLLSFEILYHAAQNGVPTAFIALEEQPKTVIKNAKYTFSSFDSIDELIEKKLLVVNGEDLALKVSTPTDSTMYSFGNILSEIESIIKDNGAKIIVIDSISIIKLMMDSAFSYRKAMISLVSSLRRLNVTGIITSDIPSTERDAIKFSQEFFIFDGIIALYQSSLENRREPSLEVLKMRGSNHSWMLSPYEITSEGFRVFTGD